MNNQQVQKLIRPYIQESFKLDERLNYQETSILLNEHPSGKIIFYWLAEGADEQFFGRYREGEFLLVLNRLPKKSFTLKNTLVVSDFFRVQKILLDYFYPLKRENFKLVGVTGTNGKTSITHLCREVSTLLGHKTLSIGTLGVCCADGVLENFHMTTPSYMMLRKLLFRYQDHFEAFFLEVSSHGLEQNRLFEMELDVGAWSSFSRDHLDYHGSMEDYLLAKKKIFHHLTRSLIIPSRQYELKNYLQGFPLQMAKTLSQRGYHRPPENFSEGFNRENLEVALEVNEWLWGAPLPWIDLTQVKGPLGRCSILRVGKAQVVIDYAHTPDALENILADLKRRFKNQVIHLLFGCGGDRDKGKRAEMGAVAQSMIDRGKIYLTSDNPRGEDPQEILRHISQGIEGSDYQMIVERKAALLAALEDLRAGEVLLVAGKGHEVYQEIEGVKYPYSDFQVVEEFINAKS
jgi:UDP-N-acetylmuramoyl-L-alanyl-D-glutamate--2,6-diaminopimelate ligase